MFTRRLGAFATAITLGLSGSVISPTAATALEPVPNLYTVNVANQSSSSDASNYVQIGSATYFFATTVSSGLGLWELASTPGASPVLIHDIADGVVNGFATDLTAIGNKLYFYFDDERNDSNNYNVGVFDVVEESFVSLTVPGTTDPLYAWFASNFVEVAGNVYFIARGSEDASLYKFDPVTQALTVADEMVGMTPASYSATQGSGLGNLPDIVAVGSKIYMADYKRTTPPDQAWCSSFGDSDWSNLRAFNTESPTWEQAVQVGDSALVGVGILGEFTYDGEQVLISAAASVKGCYFRHTFKYYVTRADGTTTQLGTWTVPEYIHSFVNLGTELYAFDNSAGLQMIDPEYGGEKSSMATVMFPSASGSISLSNAVEVDGHLVFASRVGGNNAPEYLYKWAGQGAAVHLDTVPLGQADEIAPNSASIFDWVQNAQRNNYGRSIGVVGNRAILSFYVDEINGGEVYTVGLDNTKQLVRNFNIASDGSDPDTDCFATFNNFDYVAGELPIQSTEWGKSVFVELKGEDGMLKYSVIDPGEIDNVCGFTVIGDYLYFTADSDSDGEGLYKMSADRVISRVVTLDNIEADRAFSYDGNYFFLANNDDDYDIWMWDSTVTVLSDPNDPSSVVVADPDLSVIRLTGNNDDLDPEPGEPEYDGIDYDSVEEAVVIGSKLYFTGDSLEHDRDLIFVIDLENPQNTPTVLGGIAAWEDLGGPENLTVVDGKLMWSAEYRPNGNDEGDNIYLFESTSSTFLTYANPDETVADGYVDGMFALGDEVVFRYQVDDPDNYYHYQIFRGPLSGFATELVFPLGFVSTCAAPAGNDLAVSSDEGVAYFFRDGGDSMIEIPYSFVGNIYALCNAVQSENGTYFSMPEFPFDRGPFDYEPGYLGFLTPIAVERLGEIVDEPPASPFSSELPPEEAPGIPGTPTATVGNGSINLAWTAPTSGGTPGGYAITSSPEGAVCVIVGTSASCTGLEVGNTYTFTVNAYNINGYGSDSRASNSVVAPEGSDSGFGGAGDGDGDGDGGAPGTPGTPSVTAGNAQATVQITPPTSGGTPLSYTVTASPGGATCTITAPATSCTITGLANGTAYTFSATATNGDGTSGASASSSSVTPSGPVANAPTTTPATTTPATTTPATTTPAARLAITGANVEWLMVAGLLAAIAGSGFLAFSRRQRIW